MITKISISEQKDNKFSVADFKPEDIKATFAEWDRRYREEPENFMNEVQHLLGQTAESYGEAAGEYFLGLLTGEF